MRLRSTFVSIALMALSMKGSKAEYVVWDDDDSGYDYSSSYTSYTPSYYDSGSNSNSNSGYIRYEYDATDYSSYSNPSTYSYYI